MFESRKLQLRKEKEDRIINYIVMMLSKQNI